MPARDDLAFFSTLATSGSLSAAAREFNVTPSAASKWLAQLESRLGVRLVVRSTRRLGLTQEGELYLGEGRRLLAEIDDLERRVAGSKSAPRGLLRVNASFGFGRNFMASAISRFSSLYPQLEVQLLLTDHQLSLADDAVDIGIRFGEPADARVVARLIAPHRRRIFASPAYLQARGVPLTPHELASHDCLVVRQDDVAYGRWHFRKGRQTEVVKVRGALSSNDGTAVLTWALAGHGIIMRSEWDAAPFVRGGQLQVLFDDYALPPADIHAVYPPKQHLAAKVRVFVDFLVEYFGEGAGKERLRW